MSVIKRLSATLVSNIDRVVGEIENNDAVIQATLSEMRRKVATAKVRLAQVHRQGADLDREIRQRRKDEQLWGARALALVGSFESSSAVSSVLDSLKLSFFRFNRRCRFSSALIFLSFSLCIFSNVFRFLPMIDSCF